ncbi:mechanosensitive ion channel family protein, partial [Streptomyces caniscabiei]|uniref:mechanosensitive ion channel family protein n=1 Tax=Streptomyces caniscabiei TaxID=2746961 RepID=UPI00211ADBE9
IAAQSTLSNLFAGLQIAFGDMVRLGDVVVVEGEWGTIDEITLTFLTVRTWDERRITMPVSYFTSKPFENWSRGGAQMTGTVFLHVDHAAPLAAMRDRLRDILRACPAWDGRHYDLTVTDSTPSTMEVRALVTAKDPDDLWTVRVAVREQLIHWLTETHPYALPRVNTADADGPQVVRVLRRHQGPHLHGGGRRVGDRQVVVAAVPGGAGTQDVAEPVAHRGPRRGVVDVQEDRAGHLGSAPGPVL